MNTLILLIGGYSIIWFLGMYILLKRLIHIRRNIEKRVLDFDGEYIVPAYRKPWIFAIVFVLIDYVSSI